MAPRAKICGPRVRYAGRHDAAASAATRDALSAKRRAAKPILPIFSALPSDIAISTATQTTTAHARWLIRCSDEKQRRRSAIFDTRERDSCTLILLAADDTRFSLLPGAMPLPRHDEAAAISDIKQTPYCFRRHVATIAASLFRRCRDYSLMFFMLNAAGRLRSVFRHSCHATEGWLAGFDAASMLPAPRLT